MRLLKNRFDRQADLGTVLDDDSDEEDEVIAKPSTSKAACVDVLADDFSSDTFKARMAAVEQEIKRQQTDGEVMGAIDEKIGELTVPGMMVFFSALYN